MRCRAFRTILLLLAQFLLAPSFLPADEERPRQWNDKIAKATFQATLVERTEKHVKLKKRDGVIVTLSISSLSDADKRFLDKNHPLKDQPAPADDKKPAGKNDKANAGMQASKGNNAGKSAAKKVNPFVVDAAVEVLWQGRWYPAKILKVNGKKYFIKYDDFGDNWNTWVAANALRIPQSADEEASTPPDPANPRPAVDPDSKDKAAPKVKILAYSPEQNLIATAYPLLSLPVGVAPPPDPNLPEGLQKKLPPADKTNFPKIDLVDSAPLITDWPTASAKIDLGTGSDTPAVVVVPGNPPRLAAAWANRAMHLPWAKSLTPKDEGAGARRSQPYYTTLSVNSTKGKGSTVGIPMRVALWSATSDGKRMIATVKEDDASFNTDRFCVLNLEAEEPAVQLYVSLAALKEFSTFGITWADIADSGHTFVSIDRGDVLCTDSTGKPLFRYGNINSSKPALSPTGKFLAVCHDSAIALIDVPSAKIVKLLDNNLRLHANLAFSPDGQKLVAVAGDEVCIYDLTKGTVLNQMQLPFHAADESPLWTSPAHLLVSTTRSSLLIDADLGIPLWTYSHGADIKHASAGALAMIASGTGQMRIQSLSLPHKGIPDLKENTDQFFALKPGSSVNVIINNSAGLKVEPLTAALQRELARNNWKHDPQAPISLVATVAYGAAKTVEYKALVGGGGNTTLSYTPLNVSIQVYSGNDELWARHDVGSPPSIISTNQNTPQFSSQKQTELNTFFLDKLVIPSQILSAQYRGGLGKSSITIDAKIE